MLQGNQDMLHMDRLGGLALMMMDVRTLLPVCSSCNHEASMHSVSTRAPPCSDNVPRVMGADLRLRQPLHDTSNFMKTNYCHAVVVCYVFYMES